MLVLCKLALVATNFTKERTHVYARNTGDCARGLRLLPAVALPGNQTTVRAAEVPVLSQKVGNRARARVYARETRMCKAQNNAHGSLDNDPTVRITTQAVRR